MFKAFNPGVTKKSCAKRKPRQSFSVVFRHFSRFFINKPVISSHLFPSEIQAAGPSADAGDVLVYIATATKQILQIRGTEPPTLEVKLVGFRVRFGGGAGKTRVDNLQPHFSSQNSRDLWILKVNSERSLVRFVILEYLRTHCWCWLFSEICSCFLVGNPWVGHKF